MNLYKKNHFGVSVLKISKKRFEIEIELSLYCIKLNCRNVFYFLYTLERTNFAFGLAIDFIIKNRSVLKFSKT